MMFSIAIVKQQGTWKLPEVMDSQNPPSMMFCLQQGCTTSLIRDQQRKTKFKYQSLWGRGGSHSNYHHIISLQNVVLAEHKRRDTLRRHSYSNLLPTVPSLLSVSQSHFLEYGVLWRKDLPFFPCVSMMQARKAWTRTREGVAYCGGNISMWGECGHLPRKPGSHW